MNNNFSSGKVMHVSNENEIKDTYTDNNPFEVMNKDNIVNEKKLKKY